MQACPPSIHLYHQLARAVLREGQHWLRWRWNPKFHLLLHSVGEQSRLYGSPKDLWNYWDEGAIGLSVDVAESVHIRTFAVSVLRKYMVWYLMMLFKE